MASSGRIKLKLVLLGPVACGKTIIADFLGGTKETILTETRPTKGVRIIEFQEEGKGKGKSNFFLDIELWDCSGDKKYENLWPVFLNQTDGAIFICSDDTHAQKQDLDEFYAYFLQHTLKKVHQNCMVVFNLFENDEADRKRPKNILGKLPNTLINLEDHGDDFRKEFNSFIGQIASLKIDEKL